MRAGEIFALQLALLGVKLGRGKRQLGPGVKDSLSLRISASFKEGEGCGGLGERTINAPLAPVDPAAELLCSKEGPDGRIRGALRLCKLNRGLLNQ